MVEKINKLREDWVYIHKHGSIPQDTDLDNIIAKAEPQTVTLEVKTVKHEIQFAKPGEVRTQVTTATTVKGDPKLEGQEPASTSTTQSPITPKGRI